MTARRPELHVLGQRRQLPTALEADIIEVYHRQHTLHAVCEELHVGFATVRAVLVAHGEAINRQGIYPRGQTHAHAAAKTQPDYVGCAIPRTRRGLLFCAECLEPLPATCRGTCWVGRIMAGECPLMDGCPCAQEATAERLAAFAEWKARQD